MESFLETLKGHIINSVVLHLTCSKDYLTDKLKLLSDLYDDANLRSILTKVKEIQYGHNKATNIEWLKYFPNTTKLCCDKNKLISLSLESLIYVPNLQILSISHNEIDDLTNLKFVPNLRKLYFCDNMITAFLNISINFLNLEQLDCSRNKLTCIDICNCTQLQCLNCSSNDITELICINTSNLQDIYCGFNQLIDLCVVDCKLLIELNCVCNRLTKLDLHGLINLRTLYCYYNILNTLNLNDCSKLQTLCCNNNRLTSLDLQGLTNLEYFYVCTNQLTSLDLSKCTMLRELQCKNNKILNIKNICKHLKLESFVHDTIYSYLGDQDLTKCYICLDTAILPSYKKIITDCQHIYHEKCLMTWINKTVSTCPYCRQLI